MWRMCVDDYFLLDYSQLQGQIIGLGRWVDAVVRCIYPRRVHILACCGMRSVRSVSVKIRIR